MPEKYRVVQFESPFSAQDADGVVVNVAYALAGMRDSLDWGDAPFASHLLYTQVLDDAVLEERARGMAAGLAIGVNAVATVVYGDLGISRGMQFGIDHAIKMGRPVEFHKLYTDHLTLAQLHTAILENSPRDPELIRALYARNM